MYLKIIYPVIILDPILDFRKCEGSQFFVISDNSVDLPHEHHPLCALFVVSFRTCSKGSFMRDLGRCFLQTYHCINSVGKGFSLADCYMFRTTNFNFLDVDHTNE